MDLEPATVLGICFCSALVAITGMAIYTSFGPPSQELDDPFDDHED
ncbi:photosystem II reaction center protein PsbN [Anabaena sp. UHCC 0187]|nr:photosystem II reaction center protein PsbN [Anabaena sp. UHCC 0187]MDP5016634.1 photosystem II reaction center protein PsbN [Dolichospermum sp.]MTJ11816.1 photosystem II reaction center protein PsbN [Anabaena sp. UHCC 0187]